MIWAFYIVLGAFAGFGAFTAGFVVGYNAQPRAQGFLPDSVYRRRR